jgi:hypothetical protein
LGSEAGGASVSSSSEEAESAGESREKSSIEAGSEGDVIEVGERRVALGSGNWLAGKLVVLLSLIVLIEWSVGRFGVDFE